MIEGGNIFICFGPLKMRVRTPLRASPIQISIGSQNANSRGQYSKDPYPFIVISNH